MTKYAAEFKIIQEAQYAAKAAAQAMIDANPTQWYPCGFSWVKIKPARGKLVAALKHIGMGETDDYEGGFRVYNPSGNHTQWMDAKMAGSRAYVDVLKKYYPSMRAYAVERMD